MPTSDTMLQVVVVLAGLLASCIAEPPVPPNGQYGVPSGPVGLSGQYGVPGRFNGVQSQGGYSSNGNGAGGFPASGSGEENFEPASYEFQYDIKSKDSGVKFGHQEEREGDVAQGKYYVLLPDGRTQVVEYVADQEGYKPKISYIDSEAEGYGRGPSGAGGYRGAEHQGGSLQEGYSSGNHNHQGGYPSGNQRGYSQGGSGSEAYSGGSQNHQGGDQEGYNT